MPNLLQDYEQKLEDKDDAKENEELKTSCANSEPSLHNTPITPAENENTCNAHGAALTQGENSFGVWNLSTDHAIIEQHLVESFHDLPLSQGDLLGVPCDKEELCDSASLMSMPQLVNEHLCRK
jgi:hypothetical protein